MLSSKGVAPAGQRLLQKFNFRIYLLIIFIFNNRLELLMGRKRVKHHAIPKSISLYEYEWAEIDRMSAISRASAIRLIMARARAYNATISLESASLLDILTRIVQSEYLCKQLEPGLVAELKVKQKMLKVKSDANEALLTMAREAD